MDSNSNKSKLHITQETYTDICDIIATTTQSVDKICKAKHISNKSFYDFKRIMGADAQQEYAHAKQLQAENLINKISDLHEQMHLALANCEDPRRCNAIVQSYKVEIDDHKWLASKLLPKAYGDKLDVDVSGSINVSSALSEARKRADSLTNVLSKVSTYSMSTPNSNNDNKSGV